MPTVKVVELDGTVVLTLAGANVLTTRETLNGTDTAVFSFPKHDPDGAAGQAAAMRAAMDEYEVQIFEDGATDPEFWGVLVDGETSSSDGEVTVTAPDPSWYFTRRFVDRPRTNYLSNPGFEGGSLTGWSTFGGATATAVTSPRRLGGYAVEISNTSTADAGLRTTFSITGDPFLGTNVYIAGHYQVTTFNGPSAYNLSMRVIAEDTGTEVGQWYQGLGDGDELAAIDGWLREEIDPYTPIHVPVGATWDFTLDLMAIDGDIVWDALQVVIPESLSDYDQDIAVLMGMIVTDIQDVTDKSDLNIDIDCTAVGVTIPVYALQYTEHTPADTALDELAGRDDGPDWGFVYSATSKTFTTDTQWGDDLTGSVTLSLATNVAKYAPYKVTRATTENHITYYGTGDGPDREEGYAIDTAAAGGIVLQGVYQASPSATVDMLEPLAAGQLAAKNKPGRFLTVTTKPDATLAATIRKGDRLTLDITDGDFVDLSGTWRVVTRTKNWRSQTLDLVLVET